MEILVFIEDFLSVFRNRPLFRIERVIIDLFGVIIQPVCVGIALEDHKTPAVLVIGRPKVLEKDKILCLADDFNFPRRM